VHRPGPAGLGPCIGGGPAGVVTCQMQPAGLIGRIRAAMPCMHACMLISLLDAGRPYVRATSISACVICLAVVGRFLLRSPLLRFPLAPLIRSIGSSVLVKHVYVTITTHKINRNRAWTARRCARRRRGRYMHVSSDRLVSLIDRSIMRWKWDSYSC
jgi:hypothetical protein